MAIKYRMNPLTGELDMTDQFDGTSETDSGTADGQVLFWDATAGKWTYTETSELFWDDTNKRLGVGTSGPDRTLEVLDNSNPQARLTHTDGSAYADFQVDGSGYLTISPTGGRIVMGDADSEKTFWGAGSDASIYYDGTDMIIDPAEVGSGTATIKSGQIRDVTTVSAATYDLLTTDYILHCAYTATGAITSLTLPTAQCVSGRIVIIKDSGNATTNSITVDTEGAETIDGAATIVINTDYDSISLYSDGSNWFIF